MSVTPRSIAALTALVLLAVPVLVDAETVLTEGTNLGIDVAADGRIAMDLLGGLWVVPAAGGRAQAVSHGVLPARRPSRTTSCCWTTL